MNAIALDLEVAVRERLRAATADAHRRLDRHPLLAAMLEGDGDLSPYHRMLRAYAPLYAGIDEAIAAAGHLLPAGFDWPSRAKSGWLRGDLAFFGLAPLPQTGLPPLPAVGAMPALIGLLYPVEGSTLGARMIGARLRQRFGIEEATGGRFLAGYRGDTARRWQASCALFETIAADEAAICRAIDASLATFACFEATLDAAARG